MNELLARGVWVRKPGLPPLDRYVRVSAGTPPMREAFAAALRAVSSQALAMRYAILSDVHGNLESLECALAAIGSDDDVVSLGDVVGYGPNPNECRRAAARAVRARGAGQSRSWRRSKTSASSTSIAPRARRSAGRSACSTSPAARGSTRFPYELRFPDFLLVHGAPVRYFEYILDKEAAARHSSAPTRRSCSSGTRISPNTGTATRTARSATSTCSTAASYARGRKALYHRRRQRRPAARSQSASLVRRLRSRAAPRRMDSL